MASRLQKGAVRMNRQSERGYTIIEALIVVAIIGIMTVAGVPAFMSMFNQNRIRSTARVLATDVRWARMNAISRQRPTKVTITGTNTYAVAELVGGAWTNVVPGPRNSQRRLEFPARVTFSSHTFVDIDDLPADPDVPDDADTDPDIVFLPNGAAWGLTDTNERVTIATDWKVTKPQFHIMVRPSGNVRVSD